jgi:hypothetical protein
MSELAQTIKNNSLKFSNDYYTGYYNKYRIEKEEFFYKILSNDFIIIRFYCK